MKWEELVRPVMVVSWPAEIIVVIVARLQEGLDLKMFQSTFLIEELSSLAD